MSKPLLSCCGATADEQQFKVVEAWLEEGEMDLDGVLELALIALFEALYPQDPLSLLPRSFEIPLRFELIPEVRLCQRLTRDGKLELVRALLDQVERVRES